jgi:hypothetical protein
MDDATSVRMVGWGIVVAHTHMIARLREFIKVLAIMNDARSIQSWRHPQPR